MKITSRNLTILLNDIVGSTSMIAHRSRQAMMDLLQTFDSLMRPVINHYGGRIVKTIGDAYMTVFESPTDAVLCAIRMQYVLRGYNKARAEADQIHVRIAVNSGEVQIAGDGDVFGEAVNLTARLAGVTEADQIYLTEQVYLIMNRNEVPDTLAVKKFSFKGIVEEVTVYRVVQNDDNEVYARIVADQLRASDGAASAKPAVAVLDKVKGLWLTRRGWVVGGAGALAALLLVLLWPERPAPVVVPPPARMEEPKPRVSAPKPVMEEPVQVVVPAPRPVAPVQAVVPAPQPVEPVPEVARAQRTATPFRLIDEKPTSGEMEELIRMLGSEDDNEVRTAATRLVRARIVEPAVMAAAAEKLLKSCAQRPGNEVHADAMGWLCNLLGQSKGTQYVPVLEQVAEKTVHAKTKRYAVSNAEALMRRATRTSEFYP